MLSTTSNSRREYLRERSARREKTLSEPGLARNYSEPIGLYTADEASNGAAMSPPTAPTPSNSPSRPGHLGPGYQIVRINPQFVTSLTAASPTANRLSPTGLTSVCQPSSLTSAAAAVIATTTRREPEEVQLRVIEFGAKYSQDALEHESYTNRTRRTKLARLKRFKKPYEVPWRHQVEQCFLKPPVCAIGNPEIPVIHSADRPCASNTSTPEKNGTTGGRRHSQTEPCTVTRSKSLDEIDFNKLRLAESMNHNFSSTQGLEIDSMAQNLQNLQVNE